MQGTACASSTTAARSSPWQPDFGLRRGCVARAQRLVADRGRGGERAVEGPRDRHGPRRRVPREPRRGRSAREGPAFSAAFVHDLNTCVGCHACAIACVNENQLEPGRFWRQIVTFNPARAPLVPTFHLSLACNHCLEAPCLRYCPALAIARDRADGRRDHPRRPVHRVPLLQLGVPVRGAPFQRGARRDAEMHLVHAPAG